MTIGRQHFWNETDNTLLVNQTDCVGKVNTGLVQHTYRGRHGVDARDRFQQRANGMDDNNLCAPAIAVAGPALRSRSTRRSAATFDFWNPAQDQTESKNIAFYGSDQMQLNQYFELLGAVRCDRFHTQFDDPGALHCDGGSQPLHRDDDMFSWRVGGVFHPTPNSSLYVAGGVSYNPSAELGTLGAGNNRRPRQARPGTEPIDRSRREGRSA